MNSGSRAAMRWAKSTLLAVSPPTCATVRAGGDHVVAQVVDERLGGPGLRRPGRHDPDQAGATRRRSDRRGHLGHAGLGGDGLGASTTRPPRSEPSTTTRSGPFDAGPEALGQQVVGGACRACPPGRCRRRRLARRMPASGAASTRSMPRPDEGDRPRPPLHDPAPAVPHAFPSAAGAALLALRGALQARRGEAQHGRQQGDGGQHGDQDCASRCRRPDPAGTRGRPAGCRAATRRR